MSSSKLSLIIMHDDGETHRMRISRYWVQILLILAVTLPVIGCFGLWMGFDAWLSMSDWRQEKLSFTNQITELTLKVQRLQNLEALLEDHRKPASEGIPLGLADALTPATSNNASSDNVSNASGIAQVANSQAGAGAGAAAGAAGETAGSAAPAGSSADESTTFEHGEASDVLINEGSGFKVENLQARLLDRQRLRASIDLYSVDPGQKTISGRVVFNLITADGQRYPLTNEDPLFRISRFKKIITTSALPVDMEQAENAAIVVEILIDNKIMYRNYFSIESK